MLLILQQTARHRRAIEVFRFVVAEKVTTNCIEKEFKKSQ